MHISWVHESDSDATEELVISVIRSIGFATLPCGCVVGRYRDVASTPRVVYVEKQGVAAIITRIAVTIPLLRNASALPARLAARAPRLLRLALIAAKRIACWRYSRGDSGFVL